MCLVIFCFITGITIGVSWYHDRGFRWDRDSSNWTVNLRSSTVEECEDVMSRLKKEHTENEWSMILKSLSSESIGVIFKNLNMSAVRKLNISNTPLDSKHVSTLSEILRDNKTMIELQLTNCNITDNGVRYICEGLTKNQTLTSLDITYNPQITSASTSTIAELINTTKSLTELRINNISVNEQNMSFESLSPESIEVIFKNLNMSAVRELNLSNTPLDSKHVSTLSEILPDNKTMIELQLTNCNITDNGVRYICEGLTKNQTLTRLDISDNPQVTSASTSTIAELINTTKSLRYLCVNNISFTDDDLKTICTALHSNTTIQKLLLSPQHYEYCKKLDSYQFIEDRLSRWW